MSDPAFLQFAEQCERAKFGDGGSGLGPSDAEALDRRLSDDQRDFLFQKAFNAFCDEAERHARLLQAIEAWANSDQVWYSQGSEEAKAHVRALLAQTEEK